MTQSQKLDSVGESRDTLRGGTWTLLLHGGLRRSHGWVMLSALPRNRTHRPVWLGRWVAIYTRLSSIYLSSILGLYIVREIGRDKFILRNWLTQL